MSAATAGPDPESRPFAPVSAGRRARDMAAKGLVGAAFAVALIPLLWVLYTVAAKGARAVAQLDWWTHSLKGVLPEQFGGGVYHALYGTLVQSAVAALIAIPLGLLTAIYLVEYGTGRLAKITTFTVDVLSGLPSIVAALFVFAVWISTLGFSQSAVAVSLALALLMLPIVIRSAEEMLRLVPDDLREAAYALGAPKWATIVRIVLPSAMSGIIGGLLLALARVLGETAPVLVLVGYSRSIHFDIFDGNMATLPLLIYTELANPEAAGVSRVWGAALTLIIVIGLLNALAAVAAKLTSPQGR